MFSLKPTCLKTIKAKRNNCPLLGDISPSDVCVIAYFSAEYGLHHSLPFYAGVPGCLAGDHLKEGFGNDKIEINFITHNFYNVMLSTI